jgi:hypothetical protein
MLFNLSIRGKLKLPKSKNVNPNNEESANSGRLSPLCVIKYAGKGVEKARIQPRNLDFDIIHLQKKNSCLQINNAGRNQIAPTLAL